MSTKPLTAAECIGYSSDLDNLMPDQFCALLRLVKGMAHTDALHPDVTDFRTLVRHLNRAIAYWHKMEADPMEQWAIDNGVAHVKGKD